MALNRQQFEFDRRGILQRVVPFAVPAVLSFAQAAAAAQGEGVWLLVLAGSLTAAIIGATILLPWQRLPSWAFVGPPLAYCGVMVALRDVTGGAESSFSPLLLLPIFWVALHGSLGHLATVLAGCAVSLIAPTVLIGPPRYPATEWNHTLVWLLIAPILGMTVHRLVRQTVAGERRFRSFVQNAPDVILVLDGASRVSFASPSAASFLGEEPSSLSSLALLRRVHPEDVRAVATQLRTLARQADAEALQLEARVRHDDGRWHHLEVTATNLLADPDVAGVVINARDISERAILEQRLRQLAFHDSLTGLANRTLFSDRVAHALARTRGTGRGLAVLFCDLDDFKTVNDGLGHEAGDQMLVAVARRMRSCLRPGDTAGRLGGDEFAVLLEDLHAPEEAATVAARVLTALREPLRIHRRDVVVSASIGIALPTAGQSAAELLRDADTAMYAAKRRGKGHTELYDPSMHAQALRRLELTSELDRALTRGEFILVYQPVIDLGSGKVVGLEALVRWQHPQRGMISPVDFVPLAEETGQIIPLGRWVVREACRQGRPWQDLCPDGLKINVNLSPRQLQDPELVETVAEALASSGLPPAKLVLELTETGLMSESGSGLEVIRRLKQLGVQLAIDDFGTGYSSLSYLQQLPVDIIKVDKSFVADLGLGSDRATLARGILELVRTLDVSTVAEGVETLQQFSALRDLRCELGQGYLFSRPVTSDVVADVLLANLPTLARAG